MSVATEVDVDVDMTLTIPCYEKSCDRDAEWRRVMRCCSQVLFACSDCRKALDALNEDIIATRIAHLQVPIHYACQRRTIWPHWDWRRV